MNILVGSWSYLIMYDFLFSRCRGSTEVVAEAVGTDVTEFISVSLRLRRFVSCPFRSLF